jgi:cytidine deaminase
MYVNRLHVDKYLQLKDVLADMAREVRVKGYQYRNFLVGSAILVYDGSHYRIFASTNLMPVKGGPKVCAEQGALVNARSQGPFPLIVAIVVCGQAQPDNESNILSPTLHPCGNCRQFCLGLPEVTDETIIYTVSIEKGGPTEERSFRELHELHSQPKFAA